ncbi:Beige/BEACH domain containing protein [Trichomonas vaginalis G3]|uniref:Beige/BEACH domain containing protein n=1 Tax=Trichomonas vaginalis (strain ATCC PRA-98 / G3) TaxID=412133 RepID=A2EVL9_TRIV3|nr:beige/BEACH-related family [Trichomonas vaginalis G3]EAY03298.1 Beige/BEACH domain containing protein [Trichomonas vaginalis G3]KAI5531752.1 beige/BEACH-related family [Trichomonas vaginalis G3]|eukprot:XP_001315521.1 Beige/BEACH domain containing protein [Trichomonas vaginalis G3]
MITSATNVLINLQVSRDCFFSGILDFIIQLIFHSLTNANFSGIFETIYDSAFTLVSQEEVFQQLTKLQKSNIIIAISLLYRQMDADKYEEKAMLLYNCLYFLPLIFRTKELDIQPTIDVVYVFLTKFLTNMVGDLPSFEGENINVPEIEMNMIYILSKNFQKPLVSPELLKDYENDPIYLNAPTFYSQFYLQLVSKFRQIFLMNQDFFKGFASQLTPQHYPQLFSFLLMIINKAKDGAFNLFLYKSKFIEIMFNSALLNNSFCEHLNENNLIYDYYYQLQEMIFNFLGNSNIAKVIYITLSKVISQRQPRTIKFLLNTLTHSIIINKINLSTFTSVDLLESLRLAESSFKIFLTENENKEVLEARTRIIAFYEFLYLKINPVVIFSQPKPTMHLLSLLNEDELVDTVVRWIEFAFMSCKATFTLTERCLNLLKTRNDQNFLLKFVEIFAKSCNNSKNDICKSIMQAKAFTVINQLISQYTEVENYDKTIALTLVQYLLQIIYHVSLKDAEVAKDLNNSPFGIFQKLAVVARKLEISDEIINFLFSYITMSNEWTKSNAEIVNRGPLYFITKWTIGTEKFPEVSSLLYHLIESSIPNRFQCCQASVISHLVEHIATYENIDSACNCFSLIGTSFFHKRELENSLKAIAAGHTNSINLFRLLITILGGTNNIPPSFIHLYDVDNSYFKAATMKVLSPVTIEFSADNSLFNEGNLLNIIYQDLQILIDYKDGSHTFSAVVDNLLVQSVSSSKRTSFDTWLKYKLEFTKSDARLYINNELLEITRLPKRPIKLTDIEIKLSHCDFESLKVTQLGFPEKVLAEYTAKSVHDNVIYNTVDSNMQGYVNGLVIPYKPSIFGSIKSYGGPSIFLPIITAAKNFSDPKLLVSSFFGLLSPLISIRSQLFIGKNFFACLNQVLKQIDKSFIPENLLQYFISMYETLEGSLKKEFEEQILKDFSLTKLIPSLIPDIYLRFPNILSNFKTFGKFFKVCVYSFKNDELDINFANSLYTIFIMMKEVQFNIETDLPNIFIYGTSHQSPLLSYVCLSFITRYICIEPDFMINYLAKFGYFLPIFANIHNPCHENQYLLLKIAAIVFNNVGKGEIVKQFINFTSSIVFETSKPVQMFDFLCTMIKENNPENLRIDVSFTDDVCQVYYPQFLPIICHMLQKIPYEDACNKLRIIRDCFLTGFPKVLTFVFFTAIIYIANFTKDMTWLHILFPDSKIGQEIYQIIALINVSMAVFGKQFADAYYEICTYIFEQKVFSHFILSSLLYNMINVPSYEITEHIDPDKLEFIDFMRLIPDVLKSNNKNTMDFFAAPKSLLDAIKLTVDSIIHSNIERFGSDTIWLLFSNALLYLNEYEEDYVSQEIRSLVSNEDKYIWLKIASLYIYHTFQSSHNSEDALKLLKSQWSELSDLSVDQISEFYAQRQVSKISEAVINECKNYMGDAIHNIEDSFDTIGSQIAVGSSDLENFLEEMHAIQSGLTDNQDLDRYEKHRSFLYENLIDKLNNTIGGVWTSTTDRSIHMKFDPVIDSFGRHYRLRPNKHFNDHMDASRMRDLCTNETVIVERMKTMDVISQTHKLTADSILTLDCQMCTIRRIYLGKVIVTSNYIYFDANTFITPISDEKYDSRKFVEIETSSINHMLWRRFQLVNCACEIFTSNLISYFFIFDNDQTRNNFLQTVAEKTYTPNLQIFQKKPFLGLVPPDIIEKWRTGKMSNFEYLYWLNMLAGRSYNDISQYPVYPWILSNYKNDTINFNEKGNYRKLTKPLGALNSTRLSKLIKSRKDVEGTVFDCLYRSHYSTPAFVIFYMIRIEPFTSLHILLQKDRFDNPNRLFSSIPYSWELVTGTAIDFRELIPEFFSFGTFLKNSENYDLGELSNGTRVNDVQLPPWAKNSSQFVIMNRLALESPYVSANLNHWIDLMFGYRSRGQGAEDVFNVFSPYSYSEVLNDPTISVEVARSSAYNFGTCPDQIFSEPSPEKQILKTNKICSSSGFFEFTETKLGTIEGHVVSIYSDNDSYVLLTSEGTCIKFKSQKNGQYTFSTEKYPFRCFSSQFVCVIKETDTIVVSAPYKDYFETYSLSKKNLLKTSPSNGSTITALTGSEDGSSLASCCVDSSVIIWKGETDEGTIISVHSNPVKFVCMNKRNDSLVSVDSSNLLVCTSISSGKPFSICQLPQMPSILLLSPMGLIVTVTSPLNVENQGSIEVRDLCCNIVASLPLKFNSCKAVIAQMPDFGEFLIIGIERKLVIWRLFDLKSVGIHKLNSLISEISYVSESNLILIVLENGDFIRLQLTISS